MSDVRRRGRDWPSTVVFDLDGTLVDSAGDIAAALNELLSITGLAPFSTAEVVDFIGNGITVLLTKAFSARGRPPTEEELSMLLAAFQAIYRSGLTNSTTPYAGVVELLSSLNAKGIAVGICTNKQEDLARAIIDGLGLEDRFAAVVGAAPGRPPKPSPVPLLETITRLGGNPQDAMMVGDSGVDVNCARNAGVAFVGVTFGYSRTPLTSFGARISIDSYADFGAACDALWSERR